MPNNNSVKSQSFASPATDNWTKYDGITIKGDLQASILMKSCQVPLKIFLLELVIQ